MGKYEKFSLVICQLLIYSVSYGQIHLFVNLLAFLENQILLNSGKFSFIEKNKK